MDHPIIESMERYGEPPAERFPRKMLITPNLSAHEQRMRDFNERMAAKCREEAKEAKHHELPDAI